MSWAEIFLASAAVLTFYEIASELRKIREIITAHLGIGKNP